MMLLSMVPAMAAGSNTLTIKNAVAGHTYTAYKIFGGTRASNSNDDNKLADIVWGTDINTAGQNALMAEYKDSVTSAVAVSAAEVADRIGTGSSAAVDFANFVTAKKGGDGEDKDDFKYLTGGTSNGSAAEDGNYVISGLEPGYYVVVDTWTGDGSAEAGKDYTLARYMVQVVGNAEIVNKADKPTVEKKLKNKDEIAANYRDANNVGLNDIINYQITSHVPDMQNYNHYYFIMHDEMSKGLELQDANNAGFTVKINGETLTRDVTEEHNNAAAGYYVETTTDANGTTKIDIVFKNFIQYATQRGDAIVVEYNAKLTADAVVGVEGNPNKVKLEYSTNPNEEGNGQPDDKPGDDEVTGETPYDWTKTYTVDLRLKKVDGEETKTEVQFDDLSDEAKTALTSGTAYKESDLVRYTKENVDGADKYFKYEKESLANATFKIEGYKTNDVIATYTETFKAEGEDGYATAESTDGATWYKLTDGTFTVKAPVESTRKYYDSEKKYKKIVVESVSTELKTSNGVEFFSQETTTGDNGLVTLSKIPAGKYVFTEITAPSGYNLLTAPITVTITVDTNTGAGANSGVTSNMIVDKNGSNVANWQAALSSGTASFIDTDNDGKNDTFEFNVENNKGALLPETGGVGTTIFYVAGSILVLAAAILLITKRRMGAND